MEEHLRLQVLRAATRDRQFLKAAFRDVSPSDFPTAPERIIVKACVDFYTKYQEPIASLLRSECEDLAAKERLSPDRQKELKILVNSIQGAQLEQVPVRALIDRIKALKTNTFYEHAVEEVITAQEKGKLSAITLAGIVEKAKRELEQGHLVATDYFKGLEARIERRAKIVNCPRFMIDPLDIKIKGLARGQVGLVLAPFNSGKGLFLIQIEIGYAMQGLNCLHITLEDPKSLVENRFDAALTGIPLNRLNQLPNRLKKRFNRIKQEIRGRIRIIDGGEEEITLSRIEQLWEQEKANGFIADCIVVDYDDFIKCERDFKGDSSKRFESEENYKRMTRLAKKLDVIWWTAAQGTRASEGKKYVTGKDAAEDVNKIRKCFLAIGIGTDPDVPSIKHLYVARHRDDRSRFAVPVVTDLESAIFFDRERTLILMRKVKNGKS